MRGILLYHYPLFAGPVWVMVAGFCALFNWPGIIQKVRHMKFDLKGLEDYVTDKSLESEDGVWVVFPEGRKFRILRAGGSNSKYSRAMQQKLKPHRRQIDNGTLDNAVAEDLLMDVYVRHIIKDWEGIHDAEGKTIPYSPEVAKEFFEAVPDLFDDIQRLAQAMQTFQASQIEEAKEALGED